jgi:hypothetical protein
MLLTAHFPCDQSDANKKIQKSGDRIKILEAFDRLNHQHKLKLEINLIVKNSEAGLTYTGARDTVDIVKPCDLLEVKFVEFPFDEGCRKKKAQDSILKILEEEWKATCI